MARWCANRFSGVWRGAVYAAQSTPAGSGPDGAARRWSASRRARGFRGGKILAGIAVGLLCACVHAQETKTLRWTPPTERVDGTALNAAELAGHRVLCEPGLDVFVPMPATEYILEPPAESCVARAVDTEGLESADSGRVFVTWEPAPEPPPEAPGPPENVRVAAVELPPATGPPGGGGGMTGIVAAQVVTPDLGYPSQPTAVAYPATVNAGDLILVEALFRTTTATADPAGFGSPHASYTGGMGFNWYVWSKVADGTEGGGTFSIPVAGDSRHLVRVSRITGHGGVIAAAAGTQDFVADRASPSLADIPADALVIRGIGHTSDGSSIGYPAGTSDQRIDAVSNLIAAGFATEVQATTGATGTAQWTSGANWSDTWTVAIGPPHPAAFIQSAEAQSPWGASPRAITFPFTPAEGNSLLVSLAIDYGTDFAITDDQGGTYVLETAVGLPRSLWRRTTPVGATPPATLTVSWAGGTNNIVGVKITELYGEVEQLEAGNVSGTGGFSRSHTIPFTVSSLPATFVGAFDCPFGNAPTGDDVVVGAGFAAYGTGSYGSLMYSTVPFAATGAQAPTMTWDVAFGQGTPQFAYGVYGPATGGGGGSTVEVSGSLGVSSGVVAGAAASASASGAMAVAAGATMGPSIASIEAAVAAGAGFTGSGGTTQAVEAAFSVASVLTGQATKAIFAGAQLQTALGLSASKSASLVAAAVLQALQGITSQAATQANAAGDLAAAAALEAFTGGAQVAEAALGISAQVQGSNIAVAAAAASLAASGAITAQPRQDGGVSATLATGAGLLAFDGSATVVSAVLGALAGFTVSPQAQASASSALRVAAQVAGLQEWTAQAIAELAASTNLVGSATALAQATAIVAVAAELARGDVTGGASVTLPDGQVITVEARPGTVTVATRNSRITVRANGDSTSVEGEG